MKSDLIQKSRMLTILPGLLFLVLMALLCIQAACSKASEEKPDTTNLVSTGPEIGPDSLLPAEYTCNGETASIPLEWCGTPEGSRYFALIMQYEASPTDIHRYRLRCNIPSTINMLHRNASGIGTQGSNCNNGRSGYAPPCSKGPGPKKYIFSQYALSDTARVPLPSSRVNREVLLSASKDITISSATLTVVYSRTFI